LPNGILGNVSASQIAKKAASYTSARDSGFCCWKTLNEEGEKAIIGLLGSNDARKGILFPASHGVLSPRLPENGQTAPVIYGRVASILTGNGDMIVFESFCRECWARSPTSGDIPQRV
jgi:hypothetical protein